MGDKTWTALFDNTKVKNVAGDFETVKELPNVLAEPIAHVKTRLNTKESKSDGPSQLMDRIAQVQRSLGT